jgi:hypothetical protein
VTSILSDWLEESGFSPCKVSLDLVHNSMAIKFSSARWEESMKGWVQKLGIFLLCSSTVSAVNAQSGSIVEYPSTAKRLVAPVIIDNNEDSQTAEAQASPAVADHHIVRKAPYVVEFGRVAQPVSLQPPTIRPTGASPHVQEFATAPVESFEPSMMSEPVARATFVKPMAVHRISKSSLATPGHKNVHVSMHRASSQLVPVDKLAIFPLNERQHPTTNSRFVVPESNTLLSSGKNRPSL